MALPFRHNKSRLKNMSKANLLKKLGAKQILGNVKEIAKTMKEGEKKEVYRIWGSVTGFRTGSGNYGDFVQFAGSFGAVNMLSGEEFTSSKAFLPEPCPGMLVNALSENDKVEFALSVSLLARIDLPTGYEYLVSPLVETRQADPLAHLKAAALPNPTRDAAPAPKAVEPKSEKVKTA